MTITLNATSGITTPSPVVVQGSTSGAITLAAPAVAGTNTVTFPAGTGTVAVNGVSSSIVSGTAQASTSGTSIDFTGIPSWVKRITVMLNGVSTNGTSNIQIQIGSGSVTTSSYVGSGSYVTSAASSASTFTTGFAVSISVAAANTYSGNATINLISSNTWSFSGVFGRGDAGAVYFSGGVSPALSGALDRVRITTVNGTDTFDAGTINILYE